MNKGVFCPVIVRVAATGFSLLAAAGFSFVASAEELAFHNSVETPCDLPVVAFLRSNAYREIAAEGSVTFNASLRLPTGATDVRAEFVWTDVAGRRVRRPSDILTSDRAAKTLNVRGLAQGRQDVECVVTSAGREIGRNALAFERVRKLPKRRVSFDSFGRCLVDGRLFFPLGMYAMRITPEMLAIYTNSPFNCVMPYQTTPDMLDLCQSAGIMSCLTLREPILGTTSALARKLYTQDAVDACVRDVVNRYKDHPALLAWYVCDEAPASEIAKRIRHYWTIRNADAEHPTYSVMNRTTDLREFLPTFDVGGQDSYPLGYQGLKAPDALRRVTKRMSTVEAATFGATPQWDVPQAYDWSWHWKRDEGHAGARFPEEQEMRNMLWQFLAYGSHGIISYGFHGMFDHLKGEEFERRWNQVVKTHREIERMVPVLLSVEAAPALVASTTNITCRAWLKDGTLYALAVNLCAERTDARLKVGEGEWTFDGVELGDAATLEGGNELVYGLPPFGVSIVRLKRERHVDRASLFSAEYDRHWTPALNAEIEANIERYRKADCTVGVDAAEGTEVRVEQLDHAFGFGCNIFNFDQLGDDAQDAEYKAAFCVGGLFNAATVPFYWKDLEPECGRIRFTSGPRDEPAFWKRYLADHRGEVIRHDGGTPCEWRRPAPDRVLAFCASNNVAVHGHAIIYPSYRIPWLQERVKSADDMARYMKRRIADIASYYGDTVPQWDIVNESVDRDSPVDDPDDAICWGEYNSKCGDTHIFLPKDYTLMCFRTAEDLFPKSVRLCINESWPVRGVYPPFCRKLMRQGARIDVIGFQRHQFSAENALLMARGLPTPAHRHSWLPEEQLRDFAQLEALDRPIHVSEITIPAPRGVGDLTDEEADAIQARLMCDNYRLWFSRPSVYRISYWNLVDGIGGEILYSGFYNRDMTKKAAYHALHDLIWKKWMTRLAVKVEKEDEGGQRNGIVRFRGFRGRYRLTWTGSEGKEHEKIVEVR